MLRRINGLGVGSLRVLQMILPVSNDRACAEFMKRRSVALRLDPDKRWEYRELD